MKGFNYRCLFKNTACFLAILVPVSLACLGGFGGGGGSQCCPPRAAPSCPVASQCGSPQPSYGGPSYNQPIPQPQYSAPQQIPQQPYYPPPQPQYQQSQYIAQQTYNAQPPSPPILSQPSYQQQGPPQPFSPPLNNGNTYRLLPPAQPALYEKYQPSPEPQQKPQAPGHHPQTTTSSSFGRKAASKQETSTTSSGAYGKQPPTDPYSFALQDDENDITESNAQQHQVEGANKKAESNSNEATTNDQHDNNQ